MQKRTLAFFVFYLTWISNHLIVYKLSTINSRRDTMMYSKTRHIKVKGNADINHVVRVDFYLHNGKDSLVKYVEEVVL